MYTERFKTFDERMSKSAFYVRNTYFWRENCKRKTASKSEFEFSSQNHYTIRFMY